MRLAIGPNRNRGLRRRNTARETALVMMRYGGGMYRPTTNNRDRAITLTAVLLVHVGLGLALLNLTGAVEIVTRDDLTQLISIADEFATAARSRNSRCRTTLRQKRKARHRPRISKATQPRSSRQNRELWSPRPIRLSHRRHPRKAATRPKARRMLSVRGPARAG